MKKLFLLLLPAVCFTACSKCDDDPVICTRELRMITIKLKAPGDQVAQLDSFYTIRQSNNERIVSPNDAGPQYYIVLDDSYHPRLRNQEDNFRFVGWKNNQKVVDETYRIGGDDCHIYKRSGVDSLVLN